MELQTPTTQSLFATISDATRSFLAPFFAPDRSEDNVIPFMTPIELVHARIHQAYIDQGLCQLTYEYYDRHNQIQQASSTVYVRTIQPNGRYFFEEASTGLILMLSDEQILRVTA